MSSKQTSSHGLQLVPAGLHTVEDSTPKDVLQEIFQLLEEFGPTWYTEEMHRRAKAALKAN